MAGGRIYAMGGYNYGWNTAAYSYDPSLPTQGWKSVTSLPAASGCLASVSVGGKIYSIGGQNGVVNFAQVYVYDPLQPASGWGSVSNMPLPLGWLAATVAHEKIYVMGGESTNGMQAGVYEYDPGKPTQGWRFVNTMPAPRNGLAAVELNGKIYAIGGTTIGGLCQSSAWAYDPLCPEVGWQSISNIPAARTLLSAVSVGGKIVVMGGRADSPLNGTATVFTYDPSKPTQGWSAASNMPSGKVEAPAVVVNGKIYNISGANGSLSYTPAVYEGSFAVGVSPATGSVRGGTTVTINGSNLGNGSDITTVTLCGVPVSAILSQSATQVVVTAGAAPLAINGPVSIYSTSYGLTSKSGAYTYTAAVYSVTAEAGPNGSISPSGVFSMTEGGTTNVAVQAGPGRHIAEVVVDGLPAGSFSPASNLYTYVIADISTNHVIRATFNTPPVIGVTATPTNGVAPARVLFDFSASSDVETNIVRCEVDKEGDGIYETTSEGVGRIIVEYGKPGNYPTVARVIDAYGAESVAEIPITVWGQSPSASIQANAISHAAPFAVELFGTNSCAAAGHQIVAYEWDFDGDGTYDRLSKTGMASHVYGVAGVFLATLRVTDDQGLQNKATITITVSPPILVPPAVHLEASPVSGKIPLPVIFVATVTNGTAAVEYRWDFDGDGSVDLRTAENTATHTYAAAGAYLVSVTAIDAAGLSGSDSEVISAQEPSTLRVWIVQPKTGDRVSGSAVSVNANAVPASHVASVQIQWRPAGGAWSPVGSPIVPPPADFRTTWCVTNLENGAACELRAIAAEASDNVVTSDVVTVTVDGSSGKIPGSTSEGETGGKHTKQETFRTDETALVNVYDGTSVTVPLGAVQSNVTVEVELTGANTNPVIGSAYGQANIQANRKVSLDGNPELNKPITIILPYSDTNNDGLVDGTTLPESTLTAHWFDTSDGKWKKALSCEVDTSANFVRLTTYHLTEFGLFANQNLLSPAGGGMLLSSTYEGTNETSVASLTDGNTVSYWKSAEAPLAPQVFIYGFTNYQGAICSEAVLYNYGQAGQGLTNYSQNYEILVSMDGSNFTSVTNGVLPMSEVPLVVNMGGVICRQIKLVLSSGCSSNAWELAEFEVHGSLTPDPDGDGMNDAWEMQYLGTLDQGGPSDPDTDGLNNLNEFIQAANPTNSDTDADGMLDGWEVQYGLQVTNNDGLADADGDGLSNVAEFIAGTNPTNPLSTFRLAEPLKFGTWQESITYDETYGWTTGANLRVEGFVFSWSTISGRFYYINSTTNLLGAWDHVSPQLSGTGGDIIFTNWSTNALQRFYQLEVDMP